MRNWKTTTFGAVQFLAVLFQQLSALLDADPATVANWGMLIPSGAILIGLIKAQDATK
ncbi:MAG: hypothetical protein WCH86_02365 [Kiritimatiellales bacterium]